MKFPYEVGKLLKNEARRKKYAWYNTRNLNLTPDCREVFVRLQLSTTRKNGNTNFPFTLGTFSGKITNRMIYENLIAAVQTELEKMP